MKRLFLLLIACAALVMRAHAQGVNAYAQVTSIAGTMLTLGTVDEVFDTFEDGEEAILMQMQDNVAGPNLANNVAFGNIFSIASAGSWEVVTIASHTETAGVPTTVTISAALSHPFQFSPKSSVQLISFPQLGTPNYSTIGPIIATAWNGVVGGVAALQVTGTLTLNDDITADGVGFRKGATSVNYTATCANTTYTSASTNYGEKGEGAQRVDLVNYRYARGKLITGGGGGNTRNAGGGGGGHYTAGGNGGGGYGCLAGGIGGLSLAPYVWYDRLFMGGGGGGGQQNNGIGGAGGAGGGMVIIDADILETIGPCAGFHISADGADGSDSVGPVPDGAGGGGAGGTVFLFVNLLQIDPGCQLFCHANGGAGGDVINTTPAPNNWLDTNGGGGGGGQGVVACTASGAFAGVSAGTAEGTGGTHSPAGGRANDGAGPANAGVFGFGVGGGLPVELLYFRAIDRGNDVLLEWATASEENSDRFTVERCADLVEWSFIGEVPAAGTSAETRQYALVDDQPLVATSFYRLVQIDLDGSSTLFDPVAIHRDADVSVVPQPAMDELSISGKELAGAHFQIIAADGRTLFEGLIDDEGRATVEVRSLPSGAHILHVWSASGTLVRRPVIVLR